jgi:phosphotransferase family enzyme
LGGRGGDEVFCLGFGVLPHGFGQFVAECGEDFIVDVVEIVGQAQAEGRQRIHGAVSTCSVVGPYGPADFIALHDAVVYVPDTQLGRQFTARADWSCLVPVDQGQTTGCIVSQHVLALDVPVAESQRVLGLLDEALTAGERIDPAGFTNEDVVHNDFTSGNALVRGDKVVAVIDWEGARVGDSRADLSKLAFYHLPGSTDPAVLRRLEAATGELPTAVSAALAAKFALAQSYFALRVGDPALLAFTFDLADYWLRPLWRGVLC